MATKTGADAPETQPAPSSPPAGSEQAAPAPPVAPVPPPAPACRQCGGGVDAYAGANPLKLGTAFCRPCGLRAPLEG